MDFTAATALAVKAGRELRTQQGEDAYYEAYSCKWLETISAVLAAAAALFRAPLHVTSAPLRAKLT